MIVGQYLVLVAFIRTVVEGLEKAVPQLVSSELITKLLVAVLAVVATWGYGLNAPAEFGLQSKFVFLDQAVSAVALWLAVLVGHDIFAAIAKAKG